MKITQPLLYDQLSALSLRAIVCECGGAVWCAGMSLETGTIRMSCLSCGLTTGEMQPVTTIGMKHGTKKLPTPIPEDPQPGQAN